MPNKPLLAVPALALAALLLSPLPAAAQGDDCRDRVTTGPKQALEEAGREAAVKAAFAPLKQLAANSAAARQRHADGAMTDAQYDAAMAEIDHAFEMLADGNVDGFCIALDQLRARYNLPGGE